MTTPALMKLLSESSKDIIQAYNEEYTTDHKGQILDREGRIVPLVKIKSQGSRQVTPTYYYAFIPFNKHGHSGNPVRVHRFVAYCKYGEAALLQLVRHVNNNSLDNSWENLVIGNTRDNSLDIPKEVRQERARRGGVKKRRLTGAQVTELFALRQAGWSQAKLSERYLVSILTIQNILNGKTYRP